ncbi:MAG: hypothetical protein WEA61_01680 [Anaerolineales bacterium]
MSRQAPSLLAVLVFAGLLLSACSASGSTLSSEDQIATIVAATLQAQVVPTQTAEPIDGVILPQGAYGDCANTGQVSIAYVKDGNVWIWVQGGAHSQLTNAADAVDVRISQDGCRLAYSRAIPNPAYDPSVEFPLPERLEELWVLASDGSNNHLLAGLDFYTVLPAAPDGAGYSLYRFAWQPGGHTVAFGTRLVFGGPGLAQTNDIHLVNADGGPLSSLVPPGQGGDFYFSHDGLQLAFSTATSMSVINADGSNLRSNLINFPAVITYSEYLYYPPVHWSPTDNGLMLAVPPEDGLAPPVDGVYPETTLWYVPLDGTPAWEAGAVQTAWFVSREIQFSPDLGRIAYIRQYGEPAANQLELVVALSNGSNESPAIQSPEIAFGDWGPDSDQYIYFFRGPGIQLWIGSATNPNVTPIAELTAFEAASAEIEWVEGTTFAQLLVGSAGGELSLMDTSGAGVVIDTFAQPFASFDVAN